MELVTYAEFIEDYPEFENIPERVINKRILYASRTFNSVVLKEFYNEAVELLTAHWLSLRYNISPSMRDHGINQSLTNSGVVNSVSASSGSLSENYSHSNLVSSDDATTADWARTEYGLRLLALIDLIVPAGSVVYSGPATRN